MDGVGPGRTSPSVHTRGKGREKGGVPRVSPPGGEGESPFDTTILGTVPGREVHGVNPCCVSGFTSVSTGVYCVWTGVPDSTGLVVSLLKLPLTPRKLPRQGPEGVYVCVGDLRRPDGETGDYIPTGGSTELSPSGEGRGSEPTMPAQVSTIGLSLSRSRTHLAVVSIYV